VRCQFRYFLIVLECGSLWANGQSIPLATSPEISRAEVFVWRGTEETARWGKRALPGVRGVLVLCPGQNGSSEELLREKGWRDFADREGLALAGFRFVSADEDLKDGRGYFAASRGSGELLKEGLAKAGLGSVPVFLYGFSGGAHFAMSFAAWRPERVAGFCAYSFAWWAAPPAELKCPALIVCGQEDGTRYGAGLAYFQAGRRQGKPWAWVSLCGLGHEPSGELDEFVRTYFSEILRFTKPERSGDSLFRIRGTARRAREAWQRNEGNKETWQKGTLAADNMTGKIVEGSRANDVGASVLPGAELASKWRKLHHP